MMLRFIVYGLIGWIAEVLWTGFGSLFAGDPRLRSHTYLWMLPIYGAAVFFEPVHDYLRNHHWMIRGCIYMFLIFFVEYVTGWAIRELVGVSPWQYTGQYSLDGLIRLDYAPAWFVAGLFFEKVHDFLDKHIMSL